MEELYAIWEGEKGGHLRRGKSSEKWEEKGQMKKEGSWMGK